MRFSKMRFRFRAGKTPAARCGSEAALPVNACCVCTLSLELRFAGAERAGARRHFNEPRIGRVRLQLAILVINGRFAREFVASLAIAPGGAAR
jgi:hypothetical protein